MTHVYQLPTDPDAAEDALRSMREAGPLVKVKLPLIGTTWALTTYEGVDPFLRDSERFVRDPSLAGRKFLAGMQWWMPKSMRAIGNNMMAKDGEEHRRLRLLVDKAFLRRNVEGMRPAVTRITDQLFDACPTSGEFDFVSRFARVLPLTVICELLGMPVNDRDQFQQWFAPISKVKSFWGFMRMIPGLLKIRNYLRERIRTARRELAANANSGADSAEHPGLLHELIRVEHDATTGDGTTGDAPLDDDELLAMMFILFVAGYETTTHLLSASVHTLLSHPQQWSLLCSDWSLAESAVDEVLRFNSPVQVSKPRYVAEDVTLYGKQLRRGELVIALLAAANHDPEEFPEPERFDIQRTPNRHVSFGKGIHTCLGMQLAHLETAVALKRMWERFPDVRLASPAVWSQRLGMKSLSVLPLEV